ncbi:hypothetical protein PSHT_01896 [Puccinia striiformis]|uniref:Uncharacterized protein n=3 Tax=Puccinia striiformis TaxID=27350 RepID=A0A0L0VPJ2_9BASI|nr:hypothetical protein KEM48_008936 [Puccinia striiformis f. sp. tritici PST-130]KNF01186.1 hypothetical protein PSTG_05541 [Puccinia striiformis f. sp. tritici PST-78]POW21910.1 hypothetical protein PSHT_01896 [Puccinia striiformis]
MHIDIAIFHPSSSPARPDDSLPGVSITFHPLLGPARKIWTVLDYIRQCAPTFRLTGIGVRRAELQARAKVFRDKKPVVGTKAESPSQCGDSFGVAPPDAKVPAGQISCRVYGGLGYFCHKDKCTAGIKKAKLETLTFKKCERFADDNAPAEKEVLEVHPNMYWAENLQGILTVRGWDDPNTKREHLYKCVWTHVDDPNNQRPTCDDCTYQEWQDLPIPVTKTKKIRS